MVSPLQTFQKEIAGTSGEMCAPPHFFFYGFHFRPSVEAAKEGMPGPESCVKLQVCHRFLCNLRKSFNSPEPQKRRL